MKATVATSVFSLSVEHQRANDSDDEAYDACHIRVQRRRSDAPGGRGNGIGDNSHAFHLTSRRIVEVAARKMARSNYDISTGENFRDDFFVAESLGGPLGKGRHGANAVGEGNIAKGRMGCVRGAEYEVNGGILVQSVDPGKVVSSRGR